jgi:hypothetical protein
MTTRILIILLSLGLLIFCIDCGKSKQEAASEAASEAAEQLAKAGEEMDAAGKKLASGDPEAMAEGMKKMQAALSGGKKVDPVDFRELKNLLPDALPGLKRTNATGERTAAMGMNISHAEADYQSEDGSQTMNFKLTDLGSISGMAAMTAYAWAFADFDRETETGYEKTSTISGHKAFEQYDSADNNGSLQILVSNRFLVEINGDGVTMEAMKTAANKLNLGKLKKMKDFGVSK